MLFTTRSTPSILLTARSASDFKRGTAHLPEQRNRAVWRNLVGEIVKNAIERKHHEFVVYFFNYAFLARLTQH